MGDCNISVSESRRTNKSDLILDNSILEIFHKDGFTQPYGGGAIPQNKSSGLPKIIVVQPKWERRNIFLLQPFPIVNVSIQIHSIGFISFLLHYTCLNSQNKDLDCGRIQVFNFGTWENNDTTLLTTKSSWDLWLLRVLALIEQKVKRVHLLRPHIVEANQVGGDTFLDLSLPLHSCLKLVRLHLLLLELIPPVRAALKGVLPPPGFRKAVH